MREILFRGIIKNDNSRYKRGQWAFGDLVRLQDGNDGKPHIYGRGEVFAETVGQYTGLTDKNGTKIFEGDVVNVNTNKDTLCQRYDGRNLVVRFDEYHRFVASGRLEYPLCNHYEWEVIGNIHENPELLEGGVQE